MSVTAVPDPRRQLESALSRLELAPGSLTWFGDRIEVGANGRFDDEAVVERVEELLYGSFYSVGAPVRDGAPRPSSAAVRAGFRDRLAERNDGTVSRARGWRVRSGSGDELRVERAGLRLDVRAHEIEPRDRRPARGDRVTILLPAELMGISPGYYVATGEAGDAGDDRGELIRIYFNIGVTGAPQLVALLTKAFNRGAIPFRLKVLDDPALYSRCDAAVLMTARASFPAIGGLLREVVERLAPRLAEPVPAFTKPLRLGVALAEDPEWSGASFGAHRCRLVAEAAVGASRRGGSSLRDRLQAVEAAFVQRGLSLTSPHLNPGSADVYRL